MDLEFFILLKDLSFDMVQSFVLGYRVVSTFIGFLYLHQHQRQNLIWLNVCKLSDICRLALMLEVHIFFGKVLQDALLITVF